jgi:hypothetical protein
VIFVGQQWFHTRFFVMVKLLTAYTLAYDEKVKIIKDIKNELSQPTLLLSFIFYTLCM